WISRVHENLAHVPECFDSRIFGYLAPACPAVIRAEQTAFFFLCFDNQVHPLPARPRRHRHARTPPVFRRKPISLDLGPSDSPILRFVQPAARFERLIPHVRLPDHMPEGCKDYFRITRLKTEVDRAGRVVPEQNLRPILPAIRRPDGGKNWTKVLFRDNTTFVQFFPPSADRKTPRSSFGP